MLGLGFGELAGKSRLQLAPLTCDHERGPCPRARLLLTRAGTRVDAVSVRCPPVATTRLLACLPRVADSPAIIPLYRTSRSRAVVILVRREDRRPSRAGPYGDFQRQSPTAHAWSVEDRILLFAQVGDSRRCGFLASAMSNPGILAASTDGLYRRLIRILFIFK